MAGSWRNQSSSLVGFERLAGTGKPTVAKGKTDAGGSELQRRFGYVGTSAVALGGTGEEGPCGP